MASGRIISLDLGERRYDIAISRGRLGEPALLEQWITGPDALIVTNDVVGPLYADALERSLGERKIHRHELPDGEAHKTLTSLTGIYDTLVAAGANRDTTIVALGGGVVGDVAGFAAATYQRGVRYLQVPTSLLAQVDSSVGGKTAVNHSAGKNLIGAFHQPVHVHIDTATLATLPDRELSAGLAEVIKHAIIADAGFYDWLDTNIAKLVARDHEALETAIARCCEIKSAVVAADEREQGRRAVLNLGHTFGHAIESLAGYGQWLHGEAVAAGLVMAAVASELEPEAIDRLRNLLRRAGLPDAPPPVGSDAMRAAMQLDKKVAAGRLRLVLIEELGSVYVTDQFSESALGRALASADG